MLTRVKLTNFQAHESLDLEMGRFSVLSGPSNSGKSAVLRAIAALVRNDSVGDYVRHGASDLSVQLWFEDGHSVEWVKGKTSGRYVLTRPDGSSSQFDKTGGAVPDDVVEVLRMGQLTLDDGVTKVHLNLHEQQESPFLIMDTPGYVAKVFGELTSAGKLFSAASEGNRRTKASKALRTTRQSDILAAQEELARYDNLDELTRDLSSVGEQSGLAIKLDAAATSVSEASGAYREATSGLAEADRTIVRLEPAQGIDIALLGTINSTAGAVQTLRDELSMALQQVSALDELLPQLEEAANVDLTTLQQVHSATVELREAAGALDEITRQLRRLPRDSELPEVDFPLLVSLNEAVDSVLALREQEVQFRKQVLQIDGVLAAQQSDLTDLEARLAEIDTCPTCGQEVSEGVREHMLGVAHG